MTTSRPLVTGATTLTLRNADLVRLNRQATIAGLLAGLAHEMNNSLQVIGGSIELLTDREDLSAGAVQRMKRIGEQAERAAAAVRAVLAYARHPGDVSGTPDVALVTEQMVALRRYSLGRAGIAIAIEHDGDRPFRVRGDERLLQQAVLNLIVNAEEALAGSPDRRLRMTLSHASGMVRLAVADTGPGIAAEIRPRIFEPFFTTRPDAGAPGLGLPATQLIAEAHGGRLTLAEGATGATFVLELPE